MTKNSQFLVEQERISHQNSLAISILSQYWSEDYYHSNSLFGKNVY